ncbi:MAG: metal ABC transporter permease [Flavobacteriales bacterium]|nr:metal ABC transporter permease [Flavobacteriales bacterium]
MNSFIDFISFKDPNVIYVVLGMVFINSSSVLIGTFAYLRKRSLIGDAVAHSLLPGLCLGYILAGEKDITYLFLGAFVTGWLSTYLVDYIVNKTKVKQDAAIGIVLSGFFFFFVVLLTYIQKNAAGNQGGLDHFLFGQAAAINKQEVMLFAIVCIAILLSIMIFYRWLISVSFNMDFAASMGLPVKAIEFLITSLTVLAIATGIQALGVILTAALVITPAAAARFWTHNLRWMLVLAVSISVISGIGGAYVSYIKSGMPTGPWVVLFLSLITLMSFSFSTRKGILASYLKARKNKAKILHENILKAIYQHHEQLEAEGELDYSLMSSEILKIRLFDTTELLKGLRNLKRKGFIREDNKMFSLTAEGKKESRRIVRLHRLWEQYLLKRTTIDTDHVHAGAEVIEHILSPEIERELEIELGIEGIPKEDY